ncbi:MAG: ribonuclease HI family protein [Candidatus Omnitrophica bacterium]|nr:ribonuclease HI family protein [Candidatus Omnitrophota bacterium]
MENKKLLIYIDGAARGNPGPAGIGVVLLDEKKKRVKDYYKFLGKTTNNIAEYNALVYALQEAHMLGAKEIVLHMDSELVAKQLKGEFRVKNNNIKPLFEQAIHLINGLEKVEIKHIDRSLNKEADKLANKAINLSGLNTTIG